MRRAVWVLVGIAALAAVWTWVPSAVVQRQVAVALRGRLESAGSVTVRARATLAGLARQRVNRIEIDARGARVGEVAAERLTATLEGVSFHRGPGGVVVVTRIDSGAAQIEITQADLERYLRDRHVENPSVNIDETGVVATGGMRIGPVQATARLRGQFFAVDDRDVYFRVASLDVSGADVPPSLAETVLAVAGRPILSVRDLPVPVRIDRIDSTTGRVVIRARIGTPAP